MSGKFPKFGRGHGDTVLCCGCCHITKRQRCLACSCLWTPIIILIIFIVGVLIRTAFIEEKFVRVSLSEDQPSLLQPSESEKIEWAERLGAAIKIQSISFNETAINYNEILELHNLIQNSFPAVHQADYIKRIVVNEHSLLYRVEGSVPTRNPYLLCAHLDVVPEGNLDSWSHDPFLGEVIFDEESEQDFVFGRGAIDDKQGVFGILEALEYLVTHGERPKRTFYIAFGHDEEVSGYEGAGNIAVKLEELFQSNGEKLDFILDEGMFVMKDVFPGIADPIVYVGVVEKGWAVVELSVSGVQGHASKPPRESAIGVLAHAVAKLEDERQPSMFGESVEYDTFEWLAPHADFLFKTVLGNLWLFSGILSKILGGDPATDAVQRTTTAVTIVSGGVKVNVVPSEAKAYINHRIHPAQSIEDVLSHSRDVIDDDRVNIRLVDQFLPSKVSDYSSESLPFQTIVNSALEVYPDGRVTPGIMIANTDTRHYLHLSDNIFRFSPTYLYSRDLDRFHGIDERISVKNYAQVVQFFHRMIKNADYSLIEKSELEISATYEGSGLESNDANDANEFQLVDQLEQELESSSDL